MFICLKNKVAILVVSVLCLCLFQFELYSQDTPELKKYYTANALYNKKLYKLAIEEYKNFIARYPNHPKYLSAKLGLALSYYETGNYRKATPVLEELAENKSAPHQEEIHNLLGQCLLIFNKPQEAETAFRWSVNRGKERFFLDLPGVSSKYQESPKISMATIQDLEPLERSLAGLIEALYQQKKSKEVVKVAKELTKLVPNGQYTLRAKLLSALSNYDLQDYKAASQTLNELLKAKDSPYMEHSHFLLAECQRKLGNLEKAETNYETVAKRIKGEFTSNALFRLGYIKFQQKKYKSAINDFSDLRAIYAKSEFAPQAGVYLGRCFLELNDYSEAQSVFGSLTNNPDVGAEATLWLAKTFARQKKYTEAADILKPAIVKFAKSPMRANLLFDYGSALMGAGNYPEAAGIFEKAANESKGKNLSADSLRLEAFCLNRSGQYQKSLEVCDSFLKQFKEDPYMKDALFLKAENLYFMNKTADADTLYQHFIPWEGKEKYTDEARFRMAQGAIRTKNYRKALKGLEPLLKENLNDQFFEQVYYLAGFCAFKLERWQEALSYFDKFIEMYPNKENADSALMYEALIYARLKDYGTAVARLKKLIDNYQDSVHMDHAYTELGKLLYNKKDYKTARETLNHVSDNFKNSKFRPFAEYYLGWVAADQDKSDEAIEHFAIVTRNFPNHKLAADALFQKAMLLMKEKRNQDALKEWENFLSAYKESSKKEEASFYYALALSKADDNEKAEKALKKFIEDNPKSKLKPRALYEMAWISRNNKRPLNAKDSYNALLSENPIGDLADRTTFELAELEFEQKNYDAAIGLLDKLLAKGVEDKLKERVLYRMGWCLLGREQNIPAMETFELLLKQYPESAFASVAAYQSGEGRLSQKDYENAYQHFQKAAAVNKSDELRPQALLRLGETETLTNRWEDAEKTFLEFLKDYPDNKFAVRAFMWMGWVKENLKQYNKAIQYYLKALKNGEKDEIAARSQFQIGECYFALKEYDKAIKAFLMVELNYPSKIWVPKAMLEIGQVLIKKEMDKEANEQFKKLIKAYPESEEANLARELLVERKAYSVK
jgi:TolA-binding protein